MDFKFSTLTLFLVILLVFGLAVFFGRSVVVEGGGDHQQKKIEEDDNFFWADDTEPFIGMAHNNTILTRVDLPAYSIDSKTVFKVYDNIFFDRANANLIELNGVTFDGNATSAGNTFVSQVRVIFPNGSSGTTRSVVDGESLRESTVTSVPSNYTEFVVNSTVSTPRKQVAMITWGYETFASVFVLHPTDNLPVFGFSAYFPYARTSTIKQRFYDVSNLSNEIRNAAPLQVNNIGTSSATNSADGSYSVLTNYDSTKEVMQICKGVRYDTTNGALIIVDKDSTKIDVHDRPTSLGINPGKKTWPDANNRGASGTSTKLTNVEYSPYYVISSDLNYLILYIAWGQQTIVGVLVNRSDVFVFLYVYRFDGNGKLDSGTSVTGNDNKNKNLVTDDKKDDTKSGGLISEISEYYQWLAFWNTVANAPNKDTALSASNAIAKSSVVPPVCPSCPSCMNHNSSDGVCTDCGGLGGSGTKGGLGSGSLLRDFGSGSKDLIEDAGSGTASLARDAASGTVGLARDTVSGTVGLAKDTVSGTVGLAKDTVKGTVGLAKDVLGSIKPVQVNNRQSNSGGATYGYSPSTATSSSGGQSVNERQTIPGIDPYSYYGALPPQGSKYIPITTDFSAFGR